MEQQAWILRGFLAQLERQEAVDKGALNGIAGEFARLKNQSTKYRTDKTYPTKTAEKQENIKKNRYKDILPFDHSRVKLTLTTAKNDTDYINASFIKGVSGSRAYIATQGPLPHTVVDFLRMLWEYNIQVVVMACREFEMGKKKCEVYWPQKQQESFVCEPFTVNCVSEENKGDYLSRTLRLTYRNSSRTLKQLHYVNWPDHGVPDSIPPILDMLNEMRSHQAHDDIPICIHCSAGCGRTGALCAIDYTWNLLMKQMITSDFSIYSLVENMRTQRPSLVQTKEQYELVYRTIKLLFERYLQSMDAQTCQNEVTMVQSAAITDSELCDPEEFDLMPQFQHLLDEEREALPQHFTPLPSASENLIALKSKDLQWDQQQWHLLQTLPKDLAMFQELSEGPRTSPKLVDTSPRAPFIEERIQENNDIPSLNPPPSQAVATAICLMVEDPYFDTPVSSPLSEEAPIHPTEDSKQWTVSPIFSLPSLILNDQTLELNSTTSGTTKAHSGEEMPPPLPERTPESYVLAVDAAASDPIERLSVIIPPNAAAAAVRELGGSPPSPVPPLPERTPESYELAVDQAPVEQKSEVTPTVNLSRLGLSSEWCGASKLAATSYEEETKPFVRSKSLRAKMTFTALVPTKYCDLAPNTTSNFHHCSVPVDPVTPPQPLQTEDRLTPPIPERTPESFVLTTEEIHEKTLLCPRALEATKSLPRVGMSSEWDGTSQPKNLFDAVMSRSKSVRAKGPRQVSFTAAEQLATPPVVTAEGGSVEQHDVNRRPSLNAEMSGNKSDKSTDKGMSRTKSLKFFRHKPKPKTAPPPPPAQPGAPSQSNSASSSVFKFGFGNRFGKPKGPRTYPETWEELTIQRTTVAHPAENKQQAPCYLL
ncbi:tyrosine-protein phosphatase non-receptor type 22 isoform X1 [Acanthochromis polyacanthus]|uniref:protein-tyrosine-phosphatase n=1 Tax=Acanthochromis polyacanthus TaxID=80966 RepID=A0A3Q1FS16_9TELE|nr:tyrosine-protein phosphatase non-receptor type 22 isoform X1 [Acanthochromis polyacanthus]